MSRASKDHYELTNGIGKCSVPMFFMGGPAGFCDCPAYGERPHSKMYWNAGLGRYSRWDGKYDGYVPGLACVAHGGPDPTHFGDPCVHCGTPHDQVEPGPCKPKDSPHND
jgi:hypothetical protein